MISIQLRPVVPADHELLLSIYASTRVDEMALVDWAVEQKESFLRMQFEAQTRYYTENYPGAEFQIILLEDAPIGRLYIHRRVNEIRIMDIVLMPEYRRRGIGSILLNEILKKAEADNLPVSIHVERMNPALRLYERLGFRLREDKGVYLLLEKKPPHLEQPTHAG